MLGIQNKKKRKKKHKGKTVAVSSSSVIGAGSFFQNPKKPQVNASQPSSVQDSVVDETKQEVMLAPVRSWPLINKAKSTSLMQQYLESRRKIKSMSSDPSQSLLQGAIDHFDQQCSVALDLPPAIFSAKSAEMITMSHAISKELTSYYRAVMQHSRECVIIQAIECFDQLCSDDFDLEPLVNTQGHYCERELLFKMLDQCLETADTGVFLPLEPLKAKMIWEKNRCDPLVLTIKDLQDSETMFGINEKILRGQGLFDHQLTAMDLRRTLCLMQLQDKISVSRLSVEDIGLLLHSRRIEQSQTTTTYTIPMLLNYLWGEKQNSRNNAWLSAIFTITPLITADAKGCVSVLIEHSLPMTEKTKNGMTTIFEKALNGVDRIYSAYPNLFIPEGGIKFIAAETKSKYDWSSGDLALFNVVRDFKLSGESNPHLQAFLAVKKPGVVNFEKLRRTLIEMNLGALKFTTNDLEQLVVPKVITEYFSPEEKSLYYKSLPRRLTKEFLAKILSSCMSPGKENHLLVTVMNLMPLIGWYACQEENRSDFQADFETRMGVQLAEVRLRQALRWCRVDEKSVYLTVRQEQQKYQLVWEQVNDSLLARIREGLDGLIRKNNSYQCLYKRISGKHTKELANEGFYRINWEELAQKIYGGVTDLECSPHKDSTLNELPAILRGDVIVTDLAVNHQQLTPIMIKNIATIVRESRSIRKLTLYNDFGCEIEVLAAALAKNQYIYDVEFNFLIDNKSMQAIGDILAVNKSIEMLEMLKADDKFDSDKHPLTAGLLKNSSLKWLRTRASNSRVKAIFLALIGNHSLVDLMFYDGSLDAKQNKTIFDGLSKAAALKTLIFEHCKIGAEEACCLAAALTSNKSLETLDLGFSNIGNKGASAFAQMLLSNKALRSLVLCRLWGDDNKMADEGLKDLARVLPKSKLESLSLGGDFSEDGMKALIKGVKGNSSLVKLDISGSRLDRDQSKNELQRLLAKNRLALAKNQLTYLISIHSPLYSPIDKIVVDYVVDKKDEKDVGNYLPKL